MRVESNLFPTTLHVPRHAAERYPHCVLCVMFILHNMGSGWQAGELLQAGRQKYDRGDRMGAVNLFEKVLKQVLGADHLRGTAANSE